MNNISLSQAILSGIVIDSEKCLPLAMAANITADLFVSINERTIFDEILKLHQSTGTYPDEIQIMDALRFNEIWQSNLAEEYQLLTSHDGINSRYSDWINQFLIFSKKRLERQAFKLYSSVSDNISDEEIEDLHNRNRDILAKVDSLDNNNEDNISDAFEHIYTNSDKILSGEKPKIYFDMSHLKVFERDLGAIKQEEYYVVAARPGIGKSSLVNQATILNAVAGRKGIVINMEMGINEILQQYACIYGGHNSREIIYNPTAMREYLQTLRKLEPIIKKNIKIITSADSIGKLEAAVEMHHQKHGQQSFIVVDYIQLISSSNTRDSRAVQLGEISRTLKKWTGKYKCPVIALAQLNRGMESENRRPRSSDLRDSGSIEADANGVLLLHMPAKDSNGFDQTELRIQEVEAIQSKRRSGPKGSIKLKFKCAHTKFMDHQ